MNKFMRLFALLLVVVAIVLVVLSFKFAGNKSEPAMTTTPAPATHEQTHPQQRKTQSVVVAANDLAPGQAITAADLKVMDVAKRAAGHFGAVSQVVGKIPAVRIAKGDAIAKHLLLNDLSLKLQNGERAISVPVSELSSAGNHIHAGDFVDVFFTLKHPVKPQSRDNITQSRLLLSRLRVLAFGTRHLPKPPTASAQQDKKKKDKNTNQQQHFSAHTATLAVPVNMVNRLLLAARNGKLALALRNPSDPAHPDTTLFPQPAPVLVATSDPHKKTVAGDPPGDPSDSAINRAYAGINLDGMAHGKRDPVHHTRRRASSYHRVEIIRGTQSGHITEHNGGATR